MATKIIAWPTGTGNITLTYNGQGNGTITVHSDDNNLFQQRSQTITVETTAGSPQQTRTVTIVQAARQQTNISTAVVTAANQTYSGSALTPAPTVTLNGTVIPSTGYDVAYSNNTNAGTATITVTGKGEYTGTASGTFTIAQATGQVTTAPTARNVTYSGSAQYLVTAGSGTGTMQYRYKLSTASSWSSWSSKRARTTNAGTYNVQYRAAASADGNYTVSAVGELNVVMKKAASSVSAAPTAKSLTYNTSAQTLVNVGTASGGTMYYYATTTNSKPGSTTNFSTTIPTKTNAGTYYVWYYVKGDSNHNDTTISTTAVSVTIAKANRTISFTTVPQSLGVGITESLVAQVSAGAGDGTISFSSSNTSIATVSGSTVTGVSVGTCIISATVSTGANYNTATTSSSLSVIPYEQMYLTIISLANNNTIGLMFAGTNMAKTISVSTDGGSTWTSKTSTSGGVTLATLSNGGKLLVKGTNTQYATSENDYNCFTSTQSFNVYGNVMSLVYGDNFSGQSELTDSYALSSIFRGCTKLIDASCLRLPALQMSNYCYSHMFRACSGMTAVPELPSTTLAEYCYHYMFSYCPKITASPVLPAQTLVAGCYQCMFMRDSVLSSITCLATDISAFRCVNNWVPSVSESGVFTKEASMTSWPSGASGIPSGWTTVDYSE